MADNGLAFVDDMPKASRGRTHVETEEDRGVAALVQRGKGALKIATAADPERQRRLWGAAANRAGKRVRTVIADGCLYVSLKDPK